MIDRNDNTAMDEDQNKLAWKRRLRSDYKFLHLMVTKSFSSTKTASGSKHSDYTTAAFFRTEFRTIINELRPYLIPAPDDPSILE